MNVESRDQLDQLTISIGNSSCTTVHKVFPVGILSLFLASSQPGLTRDVHVYGTYMFRLSCQRSNPDVAALQWLIVRLQQPNHDLIPKAYAWWMKESKIGQEFGTTWTLENCEMAKCTHNKVRYIILKIKPTNPTYVYVYGGFPHKHQNHSMHLLERSKDCMQPMLMVGNFQPAVVPYSWATV